MMRRRGRRRSAKWTYSNSQTLSVTSASQGTGVQNVDFAWIYPPARAQFIMNTKQTDRLQFAGCHLWLDFWWNNHSTATGLPDVSFTMYKSDIVSDTGLPDFTPVNSQYTEPSTPASITSWEEDDDDGTNPYLWQHWVKGMSPPNAVVATKDFGTASGAWNGHTANQSNLMPDGSIDSPVYMCRKFYVTQEWQPDVIVRAKRRLQKGEGIVLVMGVTGASEFLSSNCNLHWRCLSK